MNPRRWLLALACSIASVTLIDLGLGRFALGDGEFLDRPVPPYGDVREARWQAWAERRRAQVRSGGEASQSLVHDALLGWTNSKGFCSKDGRECTNSRGLRGRREFDELPPPGMLRVALFGESFVYGEEVPDGDEFGSLLAVLDPSLEVLNYGVSGFGTDQTLLRLRSEGASSRARVVCIGVMLENIVRNVSRFTRLRNPYVKGLGIKPRFRLVQGELVAVPSPFATELDVCNAVFDKSLPDRVREHDAFAETPYDAWIWKSSFARLYIGWSGSRSRDYRRAWRDEQGEAFSLMLALLSAFDREARAMGAERTLVLVFPPKEDLALVLGGGDRFWKALVRELGARGIDALDFTDALAARARELAAGESDPVAVTTQVFLRAHLNRIGNEVVARSLLEHLRAR